jgi:hypothetical protein
MHEINTVGGQAFEARMIDIYFHVVIVPMTSSKRHKFWFGKKAKVGQR